MIAAEHGLRVIRVGVLEDRQFARRRLETVVVAVGEVRAEAATMEPDSNHDVGPAPDPLCDSPALAGSGRGDAQLSGQAESSKEVVYCGF